jgi:hypothetical protein
LNQIVSVENSVADYAGEKEILDGVIKQNRAGAGQLKKDSSLRS